MTKITRIVWTSSKDNTELITLDPQTAKVAVKVYSLTAETFPEFLDAAHECLAALGTLPVLPKGGAN